jgi:hypothetical protein
MRRYLSVLALVGAFLIAPARTASAQGDGFVVGFTDVGPVLGLGGLGAADFSFGGRFERGFRELPNLNNGILGIGVGVDYWNYDDDFGFFDVYDFSYLAVAVTGNYHFNLTNKKWDPFVGAGLGFQRVSSDFESDFCPACDFSDSGVYFVGRLGLRYFWQPKLALYADVGAGAASLNVGVMFRMR